MKIKKYSKILFCFILLFFHTNLQLVLAQYQFQHLTMENGLADGWVHNMIMDSKGVVWLATHDGLSRYDGHQFKNYKVNKRTPNALPGAVLMDIKEGKDNIYWIACNGMGLVRFDAKQEIFKYFTHDPTDDSSISHTAATTLFIDSDNRIWIGTFEGGLNLFHPEKKQFTRFPLSDTHMAPSLKFMLNSVRDIIADPLDQDKLWLATHNGIAHFDKQTGAIEKYPLAKNDKPAFTISLFADSNNSLWIGAENHGLIEFDPISKKSKFHSKEISIKAKTVYPKSSNEILVATRGNGVGIYNTSDNTWQYIKTDPANPTSILSNDVDGIYLDKEMRLWVHDRYQGISTSNLTGNLIKNPKGKFVDLTGNKKFAFDPLKQELFVGTNKQTGVFVFEKKENHYVFSRRLSIPKKQVNSFRKTLDILTDVNGETWVLVKIDKLLNVLRYDSSSDKLEIIDWPELNNIDANLIDYASMAKDLKGRLWVALPEGNILGINDSKTKKHQFKLTDSLNSNPQIHDIIFDSNNQLWACSYINGVFKLDVETGIQKHFDYNKDEGGLDAWRILAVTELNNNKMWIGTSAAGVQELDSEKPVDQFMPTFDQQNGMPDDKIQALKTDQSGDIWIATSRGLVKYNSKLKSFKPFGKKDGLKNPALQYGFELTPNGDLVFGLPTGFQYLATKNTTDTTSTHTVTLSNIEVNNSKYKTELGLNFLEKLELGPEENYFSIQFSACYYNDQEKIRYRYIMDNYDPKWSETKPGNTTATFTHMPPGNYTFKVIAANSDGKWSKNITSLPIKIHPYWYWSNLAKAIYSLLVIALIIGLILYQRRKWRINKQLEIDQIEAENIRKQEQLEILEKTVEERTSALSKQKKEAEEQRERAEQSEKYKEQFLANMSHEIRAPMHAILGMTNILRRNKHTPAQEKYLNAIYQNSDNLLAILNDILDLSKIEAGKITIVSVPMNLKKVISHVIDILMIKAEQKSLNINFIIAENIPFLLMGDPSRFHQILINLVDNAIKFSEQGSINIHVQKQENQKTEMLLVSVQDSGIGISQNKLNTIFESFEQIDLSPTKEYSGTGLGLHITKQLVTLQKGEIWVESRKNKGSTFYFTLPLIPIVDESIVNESKVTESQLLAMGSALTGIKILIAEDNEFNIMVAIDDLTYYINDIQIDKAENGKVAVDFCKKYDYDIILMDIQMPKMNGYDAVKDIRKWEQENQKNKSTPIIAMTASLLKLELERCYQAGMNNYIPKPYKVEELIGTIYKEAKENGIINKNIP